MASAPTDPHNFATQIDGVARKVLHALATNDPVAQQQIPDLAAAVVEQVLARVRKPPRIDDIQTYSKAVARNVFASWLRRTIRQREHERTLPPPASMDASELDWVDLLHDRGLTPASLVVLHDDQVRHADDIRAALARLTALEQAVLHHRFVERRPAKEVAELLGYKNDAVINTTVSRIRKKLGDALPASLF